MDAQEWLNTVDRVTEDMRFHTRPFASPISTSDEETVRLTGSGNFVETKGERALLSCEHVTRHKPVEYRLFGQDTVYRLLRLIEEEPPVDLAVGFVPKEVWEQNTSAKAIPYARFAQRHAPSATEELMFLRGYAGENSAYGFGILASNGTGYCTQVKPIDPIDNRRFEIHWDPEQVCYTSAASAEDRKAVRAVDPHGLSGSLVWNTRFLEVSTSGDTWTPDNAVITGLADRWDPDEKTLLVHRVEFIRSWLDENLHKCR